VTRVVAVRYGEVFLKGENRGFFLGKLENNLRRAVASSGGRVERLHGRYLIHAQDTGATLAQAARVFGVTSASAAVLCEPELGAVGDAAVALARETVERRGRVSFKVETRRGDKRFPLPSPEISRLVGARVFQDVGLPVDVHQPALVIGVEIGPSATFVWGETLSGPGGLPVGTAGRVLLLLSGGIDSPVAGWLMQKRGCDLSATYFHSFPYTGDRTKEKVKDLARLLSGWQGRLRLRVVHFTDIQKALRQAGPAELAVVLYRRMMMRIACHAAGLEGALALVTGENLGQVASQTLENLAAIEEAATLPVLRPLLAYDKTETMALARRIGSFELSIQPYQDCCSLFVPAHPELRARVEVAAALEAGLPIATWAREAAESAELIELG
jgi:tRNA uracil 4-sulfurtransferase